ncbi:MAG: electron transfer flavoprotein subunit alpha/FixB family protein, partial [Deltaproteobacteria bacterium]|nr:electron transfer flavoprotein subunit alpha/FixB family protein [Deltaproteobacteria bacterium]
ILTIRMQKPEWNPDYWARAIVDTVSFHDINILFGLTSAQGKDLLPRVAAILEAPLVMDCIYVNVDEQIARTSQYSGKTLATFRLSGETVVYGLRPNAVTPIAHPKTPVQIEHVAAIPETADIKILAVLPGESGGQNLSEAEVIISGGRGMADSDNFKLLRACAKAIDGAAVGASRVAVDNDWVPYVMQVGQTGSKVNPKVYIACGISGSIQHLAGMKTSGMIIAINTDPDAAIFSHSDYYVVGDVFEILPALANELENYTLV